MLSHILPQGECLTAFTCRLPVASLEICLQALSSVDGGFVENFWARWRNPHLEFWEAPRLSLLHIRVGVYEASPTFGQK